jgi:hypothetical protein
MNIVVEPRQLKILAVLCVLGVLSVIGTAIRGEKPPASEEWTRERCIHASYSLAVHGGLVAINGAEKTLADIKARCP